MADFALYWKNFVKDQKSNPGLDLTRYTSDESLFRRSRPGDRLWFYASGAACRESERVQGYLVQVATVLAVRHNPGDAPGYPAADFRYLIECDPDRSVTVDPPLLIDHVLFPGASEDRGVPVGTRHQRASRVKDATMTGVLDLIWRERDGLFRLITECWQLGSAVPVEPAGEAS